MSGIYIHVPFCKSKCPYCDFYSMRCDEATKSKYVDAVIDEIKALHRCKGFVNEHFNADTLYLGGGTPSVLSGEQIAQIVSTARECFNIPTTGEITIECNPGSDIESLIPYFKECGVNRISLGMQSAVDEERKALGRGADRNRIRQVINLLKANEITNISLDIMLGIPHQTKESLTATLDFIAECDVPHVSAYMLKIEEGTFFDTHRERYTFPDEDTVCDLYTQCVDYLTDKGFCHYEISNLARQGYESRHNTKYWRLDNYLGIGPSAHSFIDGKRFYFDNSLQAFIDGTPPVFDGNGGDREEYIMLRLRLKDGLSLDELTAKYGKGAADGIIKKALLLKEQGLVSYDKHSISLTEKGFLLSNSVILELLD
ncbi:MAG: radical SAM family heme chaperone HemW [Clostridia bacterium]|nr:radical SAM family heme chaperone HemW [Clostridia bacterium]